MGTMALTGQTSKPRKLAYKGAKVLNQRTQTGCGENPRPLAETLSNLDGHLRGAPSLAATAGLRKIQSNPKETRRDPEALV